MGEVGVRKKSCHRKRNRVGMIKGVLTRTRVCATGGALVLFEWFLNKFNSDHGQLN